MKNRNWLKRITRSISSGKLAVILIAGLALSTSYGALISAKAFSSWWFLILVALLVLNTATCTTRQWRAAVKKYRQFRLGVLAGRPVKVVFKAREPEAVLDEAVELFRSCRYVTTLETRRVCAYKNTVGLFGSPLLHTALVALIISAVLGVVTGTWGRFGVIEQEVFTEAAENYVVFEKGLLAPDDPHRYSLQLNKVVIDAGEEGKAVRFAADITVFDPRGGQKAYVIDKRSPLKIDGVILYQHRFGYAPIFSLVEEGRSPVNFIVALETVGELGEEQEFSGRLVIPSTSREAFIQFHPGKTGKVEVTIEEEMKVIATALLAPGDWLDIPGGRLQFTGWRYWASFTAVGNPWRVVTFAAFWVAVLGLAAMYLFNPKIVQVTLLAGGGVEIAATSSRFKALFEMEVQKFADRLKQAKG